MLPHLADDVMSALIDDRLDPPELREAQAHLDACPACAQHVEELRSVVLSLRALPEPDLPRSFVLGPRAVADPPNLVRVRRWYTATRIAAATFAAGFVFLSAGALYVDSRPAQTSEVLSSAPAGAVARDAVKPAVAPAAAPPPQNVAAPAAARAGQSAGAPGDASDQVAAATTVRPLPTAPLAATVVVRPTVAPVAAPQPAAVDAAAPLRTAALGLGVLTVLALLAALVARHRVQAFASRP